MNKAFKPLACMLAAIFLAGCGLSVPSKLMDEAPDKDAPFHTRQGDYENKIVSHLVCEVAQGIYAARSRFILPWLASDAWGTAITLTITAEDQSSLNPGLSVFTPFRNHVFTFPSGGNVTAAQSFTMGVGGSISANSTRTETIQFTLVNSALFKLAKNHPSSCEDFEGGLMIDGDLKIREFVYDKAEVGQLGNANLFEGKDVSKASSYPFFNTFTETINFVSTYSGSANPSWKFAQLSNNTSGSGLVNAQRTYTNTAIITIGHLGTPPSEVAAASLDGSGSSQHQAQVQGSANATLLKAQTGF